MSDPKKELKNIESMMFGKGKSIWWWKFLPNLYSSDILIKMNKKITITLELDAIAVGKIEAAAEEGFKTLLEKEINENADVFIEMLGLDNW